MYEISRSKSPPRYYKRGLELKGVYKKSWESREEFRGWLKQSTYDEDAAFCRACKLKLPCDVPFIRRHALTPSHVSKWDKYCIKQKKYSKECGISSDEDEDDDSLQKKAGGKYKREWERVAPFQGWLTMSTDTLSAYCNMCEVPLSNSKSKIMRHALSIRHCKKTGYQPKDDMNEDFKRPLLIDGYYKKEWERINIFKPWLRESTERNLAHCKFCKINLHPHRTKLEDHGTSARHLRIASELKKLTKYTDISEDTSDEYDQDSSSKKYTTRYKKEWERLEEFRGWLTMSSQTLSAYCKLCDVALSNTKSKIMRHALSLRHGRKIEKYPKDHFVEESEDENTLHLRLEGCYKKEWEQWDLFKPWLSESLEGKLAYCSFCEVNLLPYKNKLEEHASTDQHTKAAWNCDKRETYNKRIGNFSVPNSMQKQLKSEDYNCSDDKFNIFSYSAIKQEIEPNEDIQLPEFPLHIDEQDSEYIVPHRTIKFGIQDLIRECNMVPDVQHTVHIEQSNIEIDSSNVSHQEIVKTDHFEGSINNAVSIPNANDTLSANTIVIGPNDLLDADVLSLNMNDQTLTLAPDEQSICENMTVGSSINEMNPGENINMVYEDSFAIFGRFVANELRTFLDKSNRGKVKKKIKSILHKGDAYLSEIPEGAYLNRSNSDDRPIPQLPDIFNDDMSRFGKYVADNLRNVDNFGVQQMMKYKICSSLCKLSNNSIV